MKILVLGATGMAGHMISIYLHEAGHDVTAFSRKPFKHCKNINGDITDFKQLQVIVEEGNYDAIINAIGILNQDAESNKPHAVLLNSYLPHYLSHLTETMKTKIIHISTDCVFSGKTGDYTETSFKDGETFYDRSKALGELTNQKDLTFRCSIIGPDMTTNGIGLFNWFMKQSGAIKGYKQAIWTGVSTLTLAKAIEKALEENLCGLYNLVNNQKINKYDLLELFNHTMKDGQIQIVEDNQVVLDKSLINTRKDFSFIVPKYSEMVVEMKHWIQNHSDLYSHYSL
jgi:dTDP-4-dehydrorhamnose reductase